MKRILIVGLPTLAALLLILTIGPATGQVKKGKTRPLTTHQLMSGLVRPNCAVLGKGVKKAPTDDKGWHALATNAALLNEASYVLMADGRCPDGVWAGAAKTLREGSAAALKSIDQQDAAGTATAFKSMTQACAACHKAHRPKKKK